MACKAPEGQNTMKRNGWLKDVGLPLFSLLVAVGSLVVSVYSCTVLAPKFHRPDLSRRTRGLDKSRDD